VDQISSGAETHPHIPRKVLSKTRLFKAFEFAFAGIRHAWQHEPNFKIEVAIGGLALLMALWLGVSPVPILLCIMLVLPLELLNSALEAAIDLISPERHPLAKLTKDAAAGAVLVASLLSALIGLWVLGPALLAKLGL
jgi:diacylglycerol kinase (ATP)